MPLISVSTTLRPWGPLCVVFCRSVESLLEELVVFGFLRKSETVTLKDYIGERPPQHLLSQAEEWCPGHGPPMAGYYPLQ